VDQPLQLSAAQTQIVSLPLDAVAFVEGPAGCGKTTAGVERLLTLLDSGIDGQNILVLVPQRTLAFPYYQALESPELPYGGLPTVATLGGIARRSIELFWPLIAAGSGFKHPNGQPTFLTLETSQYYMAHLVTPLLEKGYSPTNPIICATINPGGKSGPTPTVKCSPNPDRQLAARRSRLR